ncbi:MAG: thermosome subunit, partial [ANME-2 cluster archaeon]|nr:thermosome subunit [ANME-2 cluster archaeon]
DKMLVDGLGDVVITNDGVTILREMDIEHPAAKMVVEVAKTQDDEVGDGTTTAAVLAGELLKVSEELLEQDVHPTIIASGYRMAADKTIEILKTIVVNVDENDDEMLLKISNTAITGKGAENSKNKLSKLIVRAVRSVVEEEGGKKVVDIDNIKMEKKVGASVEESELIEGMVIDKERVHPNMPKQVKNAKIALVSEPVEFKKTEVDAEISITSPDQLQQFLDQEEKMLKEMVDKIINSGANVVVCQKGIDDMAQHYLAKAGILAVRRVKKSDMEKLSRASGASVVTNVVDSIERAMEDALRVVGVTIEDGKVVAGGGSPEIELSLRLREYAATLKGREQLAVSKFADALEVIPRTLAENAGLDPIDMLVELRSQHEKGNKNAGLDVYSGDVIDMLANGVVEPLRVKTQAINSATEAAVMILRIDDVIASKGGGPGDMPPEMMGGGGGMPPGMGGMPPMM